MASVTFSFALGAGMLAAFNPCAFAMLPSFLAFFLGMDDADFARQSWLRRAWVGMQVGLLVVVGFVLIFLAAGLLFAGLGTQLVQIVPWLALGIGGALVVFGALTLLGRGPHVAIPNPLAARQADRSTSAIFLYGIGYGIASLSCTLPIFLMIIGSALSASTLAQGIVPFAGYSGGMALVVVGLTLATALLKGALVQRVRGVLPYVNRLSGLLLIAAGAYIIYFQVNFSIFFAV